MTWQSERGAAVVVALLATTLLGALATVMLLASSSDVLIAGAFREQRSALYAADAIVARAIDEIATWPDWNTLLISTPSPLLVDGPPFGARALADGSTIDLQQVVNMANCEKATACTLGDLTAVTEQRPWGATNPQWRLYAYGPLHQMMASAASDAASLPWYVVLFVSAAALPTDSRIVLRAEAFGPRKGHAVIELLAARPESGGAAYNEGHLPVNILSWREVR